MKRALTRIATLAVALPLALGTGSGTANASHSTTIPGCFGGGSNATVICNFTVIIGVPAGVQTYETSVPVCAGTCQQVPVTLARPTAGEPLHVCYRYNTLGSLPTTTCYTPATVDPWVQYVAQALQDALYTVDQTVQNALATVDRLYYRYCNTVANALEPVIYLYCG